MNTISSAQFSINNIQIGELEEKKSKNGEVSYKSAKIEYKYNEKLGRLNVSSIELDQKKGGSVVFYGCRLTKVMKFGTKDVWTGDYQLSIPLYQNPKAPSKDEVKYMENIKQIRRRVAMELACDNGLDSTDKEIEKAFEEVKDPISQKMKYVLDPKTNAPVIMKNGKKKVAGIDDTKSPTIYVKLYSRKEEEGDQVKINTKFFDSKYNQIQNPEELIGKLLDCCIVIRYDTVYKGSNGYSIQMKVSEVGLVRVRDVPPMKTSKLEGFMDVIPKVAPEDTITNNDSDEEDDD